MPKSDKVRKQRNRYIQAMEQANDALNKQVADLQNNLNAATRYMAALVARNGGTVTIPLAELDGVKDRAFTIAFDDDHTATFTVHAQAVEAEPAGEAAPPAPEPLTVEIQPSVAELVEQPEG